jgi:hypothetical protein
LRRRTAKIALGSWPRFEDERMIATQIGRFVLLHRLRAGRRGERRPARALAEEGSVSDPDPAAGDAVLVPPLAAAIADTATRITCTTSTDPGGARGIAAPQRDRISHHSTTAQQRSK